MDRHHDDLIPFMVYLQDTAAVEEEEDVRDTGALGINGYYIIRTVADKLDSTKQNRRVSDMSTLT